MLLESYIFMPYIHLTDFSLAISDRRTAKYSKQKCSKTSGRSYDFVGRVGCALTVQVQKDNYVMMFHKSIQSISVERFLFHSSVACDCGVCQLLWSIHGYASFGKDLRLDIFLFSFLFRKPGRTDKSIQILGMQEA